MVRRIGVWALCGLVVAFFWFLYFTWLTYGVRHGGPSFSFNAAIEILVNVTAPVRPLFGHYPITWYWSMVLNAVIYGGVGLMVETVRFALHSGLTRQRQ